MLVKGDNELVFEVPDSVASSMVSAGIITPADDRAENPPKVSSGADPKGADPAQPSGSKQSSKETA